MKTGSQIADEVKVNVWVLQKSAKDELFMPLYLSDMRSIWYVVMCFIRGWCDMWNYGSR